MDVARTTDARGVRDSSASKMDEAIGTERAPGEWLTIARLQLRLQQLESWKAGSAETPASWQRCAFRRQQACGAGAIAAIAAGKRFPARAKNSSRRAVRRVMRSCTISRCGPANPIGTFEPIPRCAREAKNATREGLFSECRQSAHQHITPAICEGDHEINQKK
jgi:hypothetical protein